MKILFLEDKEPRLQSTYDIPGRRSKWPVGVDVNIVTEINKAVEAAAIPFTTESFFDDIPSYKAVFTHKGFFHAHQEFFRNGDGLEVLKSACRQNNVPLVVFTGSENTDASDVANGILQLTVSTFYSPNLELFLEDLAEKEEANLLILRHGIHYKLNILLNAAQEVNKRINLYDVFKIPYSQSSEEAAFDAVRAAGALDSQLNEIIQDLRPGSDTNLEFLKLLKGRLSLLIPNEALYD